MILRLKKKKTQINNEINSESRNDMDDACREYKEKLSILLGFLCKEKLNGNTVHGMIERRFTIIFEI